MSVTTEPSYFGNAEGPFLTHSHRETTEGPPQASDLGNLGYFLEFPYPLTAAWLAVPEFCRIQPSSVVLDKTLASTDASN